MIFASASGKHRNLRCPRCRPGPVKDGFWEPSTPPARLGGKPINSRNLRCPGRPPDPVFCGIPGALGTRILRAQMASKNTAPPSVFWGEAQSGVFYGPFLGTPWAHDLSARGWLGAPQKRVQRDSSFWMPFGARAKCRILRCPGGPGGPVSYDILRGPKGFKKGCPSAAFFGGSS